MATYYIWHEGKVANTNGLIFAQAPEYPINTQICIKYSGIKLDCEFIQVDKTFTWANLEEEDVYPEFKMALTLMGVL